MANNINAEDAESFRIVVNDSLKQIAKEGFDPVQVDSTITSLALEDKLAGENGDPVETIVYYFAYYYAVTGNPFEYLENMEARANIKKENESGALTSAIESWMTDPELYTLITTYPEPGLKETRDAELAVRLAEIKAGTR